MLCWFHSLIFFRTLLWVKLADFAHFFSQKNFFYICGKPAKFGWCGLEGFYPLKIAVKVTLGVFQNLLSNSVNS